MSVPPLDLVINRHDGFSLPLTEAVFPVDKPTGISSFGIIRELRKILGIKKIGHAGTLDPLATGLLICCVGRPATRQIHHFQNLEKEYTGIFRLGIETRTYDSEGEIVQTLPWEHISAQDIVSAMDSFVGSIEQLTPAFSAVKVDGVRLYKRARRGEDVKRPLRQVEVREFALTGREGPDISFRVTCSKGTYVRCLAHDTGQILKCGAHLINLRRTRIGGFSVNDAWDIDSLRSHCQASELAVPNDPPYDN